MSLTILTALAVFFHLGTSIAAVLLKDNTDQAKIAALNSKVDQVLGVVTALAPVLPTSLPKTLGQGLTDVVAVAGALAPSSPAPQAIPSGASAPSGNSAPLGTGATVLSLTSGGLNNAG